LAGAERHLGRAMAEKMLHWTETPTEYRRHALLYLCLCFPLVASVRSVASSSRKRQGACDGPCRAGTPRWVLGATPAAPEKQARREHVNLWMLAPRITNYVPTACARASGGGLWGRMVLLIRSGGLWACFVVGEAGAKLLQGTAACVEALQGLCATSCTSWRLRTPSPTGLVTCAAGMRLVCKRSLCSAMGGAQGGEGALVPCRRPAAHHPSRWSVAVAPLFGISGYSSARNWHCHASSS